MLFIQRDTFFCKFSFLKILLLLLAWFFSKMLAVPHVHQAKDLEPPKNENFTFLQLFIEFGSFFSFWGTINFLS